MAPDPLQTVLTLLSNNWVSANTDAITPSFAKITGAKSIDFDANKTFILAQRNRTKMDPAGLGPANKNEAESFELDIRTIYTEAHFLNVIEEVKRVLQAFKTNVTDYTYVEFDGSGNDMSDKTRQIWRYMFPVQLVRLNVSR